MSLFYPVVRYMWQILEGIKTLMFPFTLNYIEDLENCLHDLHIFMLINLAEEMSIV